MSRPDIHEALDVRSYERVVVATATRNQDVNIYPEGWELIDGPQDIEHSVDEHTVVVIDKVGLANRTFVEFFRMKPRLLAVVVRDIPYEKSIRRTLSSLYPFAEVWTFSTDFGKLLVTSAKGDPYDRDDVLDARPEGSA